MTVNISIIVRTYNEEKYLPYLLNKIRTQSLYEQTETIIVDSGSTDSTLAIANDYETQIISIEKRNFTFGRSLNLGCDKAKGKYLVIVSAHCIPENNYWIENLINPLLENLSSYSYGRQIGSIETFFSESQIFNKYYPQISNLFQKGFFCNNANSAITKKIWAKYKFDETLTGLEDIDLAKKIYSNGGNISYISEACVYHCHKETWRQISRRFERESFALLKISPEITINKLQLVYFIFSAILFDFKKAFSKELLFKKNNLINIVLYRSFQFWGSYQGNKITKEYNNDLSNKYFYPSKPFKQPSYMISEYKKETLDKMKVKCTALLPMKMNSTRVKGKNFKSFAGKPLYAWILNTLLNVEQVDEIIINTDASEILMKDELMKSDKIKIIERPKHLCGDEVSMNRIIEYDLSHTFSDFFIMTHTTNPLLSKESIGACIDEYLMKKNLSNNDSLFTVNAIQTRFYTKNGKPINHNPKNLIPTQDLETFYEENSNLYIFSKESFLSTESRIGKNPILFETPKNEAIDIDTNEEWEMAESMALYKKRNL